MTVRMYTTVIAAIRHTVQQTLLSIQQNARLHVVAGSHRSEKVKAGSLLFVALPIRAVSAGPIAAGPNACTCIVLPSGPIV